MLERLRNWFRTPSQTPSEPPPQASSTAEIQTLHELATRVAEIEAREAQMQLAWQETLDKLGRWASKQAARERRRVDRDLDQLAGDGPDSHEDPAGAPIGGGSDLPVGGNGDRAAMKAQLRQRAAQLFPRR